jgi:NAD(P)-dependent dehydrogenase (short-subunit alcohol dehydrogenase family)
VSSVKFIQVNVASWTSQLALFAAALDFFPDHEMSALVTCAGVSSSPSWEISPAVPSTLKAENDAAPNPPSAKCLEVNLIGTMYSVNIAATYCMGAASHANHGEAPGTLRKSIILMGSTSGFRSLLGKTDYSVAKWGVRGLFRNIRSELPKHGIRTNMLAPFWVPTPLTKDVAPVLERQGIQIARLEDAIEGVMHMITDSGMNGESFIAPATQVHAANH